MRTKLVIAVLFLLVFAGCNKQQSKPPISELDRVNTKRVEPINFLHKTFSVKKYAQFSFEVPVHTAIPRLHGTFKSFIRQQGEDNLSDDSTDVDFLLLNADQFTDFSHGHFDGTALYSVDPTHDHEVEFMLPPTQEQPVKYYVVFRNSPGGAALKYVEANFSLNFGY